MPLTRGKVIGGIVVVAVITAVVVVAVVMSQRSDGTPPPSSAPTSGPENVDDTPSSSAPTSGPENVDDTPSCYDSKYYTRYVPNVDGSLADGSMDDTTYSLYSVWNPVHSGYVPMTFGMTVDETPDVTGATECTPIEKTLCANIYNDGDGTSYCDIIGTRWCIIGDEFCMTNDADHNNRVHVDGLDYDGYFTQP